MLFVLYYITKWSTIDLRAITSVMFMGSVLIILGMLINGGELKKYNVIALEIPPLLFILGIIFIISPLIIKPEKFSKALKIWVAGAVISLGLILILAVYLIVSIGFTFEIIASAIAVILISIFLINRFLVVVKPQILTEVKKKASMNILEMFKRPTKVTEEEVSVSKEKKICLVCKTKLSGFNIFLCGECSTFYCKNCAHTLSDLENLCWVCSTPFDKSKPVKLPKKEVDKLMVEEEIYKENLGKTDGKVLKHR